MPIPRKDFVYKVGTYYARNKEKILAKRRAAFLARGGVLKKRGVPKGYKYSEEVKAKLSLIHRGPLNHRWKGGITPANRLIRRSYEYRLWRTAVFERDDYTCVWCKEKGVRLQADHIKPFASYPELRFVLENGRTLCVPCHRKTDTFGARKTVSVS